MSTGRTEIDAIVTEFGAAHLRGCSLRERGRRLIEIAHPDHREALEPEAQGRAASPAEAQRDALVAAVRAVIVGLRRDAR